jgi:hypothetical protein
MPQSEASSKPYQNIRQANAQVAMLATAVQGAGYAQYEASNTKPVSGDATH